MRPKHESAQFGGVEKKKGSPRWRKIGADAVGENAEEGMCNRTRETTIRKSDSGATKFDEAGRAILGGLKFWAGGFSPKKDGGGAPAWERGVCQPVWPKKSIGCICGEISKLFPPGARVVCIEAGRDRKEEMGFQRDTSLNRA